MTKRTTKEGFINRARAEHGNKYSYDKVVYKGCSNKVIITCKEHGDFLQTPGNHYAGKGCKKCGNVATREKQSIGIEEFIRRSREKHGDKYDYSNIVYSNCWSDISLVCPIHGEFKSKAIEHYNGGGCPKCGHQIVADKRRLTDTEFIRRCKEIHGDKYDYSLVKYVNNTKKVDIICKVHNKKFSQTAGNHLAGRGCPICKWDRISAALFLGLDEFIRRAKEVHGDKYSYDKAVYTGYQDEIIITCPTHGDFTVTPDNILHNHGCSKCAKTSSQVEDRIADFLSNFTEVKRRNRKILGRREIDIVLPKMRAGIEYNGSIWHSERFSSNPRMHMREKCMDCEERNVKLVNIMDYENEFAVLNTLAINLGIDPEKIEGEDCWREDGGAIENFLNRYGLMGYVKGRRYYSIRYRGQIVAVCSFKRSKDSQSKFEVLDYTQKCKVTNGLKMAIAGLVKDNPDCCMITGKSDKRWPIIDIFRENRFSYKRPLMPDYRYVSSKSGITLSKNNFKKSRMGRIQGFSFDQSNSGMKNCHNNKWYRVWDCGFLEWELIV